ncbi:hypothetical protein [Scytonema sp. UIC 10036]|nr:hypothetical protein [Scytonema sp. UIC 10036]
MKKSVIPRWAAGRLLVIRSQLDSELFSVRMLTWLIVSHPRSSPKWK